jgi:hypothetical protein
MLRQVLFVIFVLLAVTACSSDSDGTPIFENTQISSVSQENTLATQVPVVVNTATAVPTVVACPSAFEAGSWVKVLPNPIDGDNPRYHLLYAHPQYQDIQFEFLYWNLLYLVEQAGCVGDIPRWEVEDDASGFRGYFLERDPRNNHLYFQVETNVHPRTYKKQYPGMLPIHWYCLLERRNAVADAAYNAQNREWWCANLEAVDAQWFEPVDVDDACRFIYGEVGGQAIRPKAVQRDPNNPGSWECVDQNLEKPDNVVVGGQVLYPPYQSCRATYDLPDDSPDSAQTAVEEGFAGAWAECEANTGSLNLRLLALGGTKDAYPGIPSSDAFAFADQILTYVPNFTGKLTIEAVLSVEGKITTSAGSAYAWPELASILNGILLELNTNLINKMWVSGELPGFIGPAAGIVSTLTKNTAAHAELKVHLFVTGQDQFGSYLEVGRTPYLSFFPSVDNLWNNDDVRQTLTLVTTIDVRNGEQITVHVGQSALVETYGWASASWNIGGQSTIVESLTFSPQ